VEAAQRSPANFITLVNPTLITQDKKTIFICIVFTQLLVKGLLNSMVPHYGVSSLNTSKIYNLLKSLRNC